MTTPDVAALAARLTFHAEVWRKLHENFPAVAADLDAAAALLATPETQDEPCQHGNLAWAQRSYCPCADCVIVRHRALTSCRCNRCHAPMEGGGAMDGASQCGGLIEAVPLAALNREARPRIVCLCGSTRFMDEFFEAG